MKPTLYLNEAQKEYIKLLNKQVAHVNIHGISTLPQSAETVTDRSCPGYLLKSVFGDLLFDKSEKEDFELFIRIAINF